jgi:hypothetical protein
VDISETEKLARLLFKFVQTSHHQEQWSETPTAIQRRVREIMAFIKPPMPDDKLRQDLRTLGEDTIQRTASIVTGHIVSKIQDITVELKNCDPAILDDAIYLARDRIVAHFGHKIPRKNLNRIFAKVDRILNSREETVGSNLGTQLETSNDTLKRTEERDQESRVQTPKILEKKTEVYLPGPSASKKRPRTSPQDQNPVKISNRYGPLARDLDLESSDEEDTPLSMEGTHPPKTSPIRIISGYPSPRQPKNQPELTIKSPTADSPMIRQSPDRLPAGIASPGIAVSQPLTQIRPEEDLMLDLGNSQEDLQFNTPDSSILLPTQNSRKTKPSPITTVPVAGESGVSRPSPSSLAPGRDRTSVQVHENQLKSQWTLNFNKKTSTVVLGDSNVRCAPEVPPDWEIHSYPGARLAHVADILRPLRAQASTGPFLDRLIIAVGINDRGASKPTHIFDEMKKAKSAAEKIARHVSFLGISLSRPDDRLGGLDAQERAKVQYINSTAARLFKNYIKPLHENEVNIRTNDPQGLHHTPATVGKIIKSIRLHLN